MATYNGEKYLRQQIDSILPQLGKDDELIISDDNSSDSTIDIIKSYTDSRIKLLHHLQNQELKKNRYSRSFYYATSNFENALKEAKGDCIFLSDQDDVWCKDKVKKVVPLLEKYDCVMTNNQIIDSDGKPLNFFLGEKKPFGTSVWTNLKRTPFLGCCMAFSRKSMSYILPFPKNLICHDLWMGCLCAYYKSMYFLNEPLHQYRHHDNQVSPSVTANSKNPWWFRILYRIQFLIGFYIRIIKE